MIALIAAAAAIQSTSVVEWFEPTADVVSIQAVVKVPKLDPRNQNLLRLIATCVGSDTSTYSAVQIADIAARTGSRVRVTMMEDHIRVGMSVVPADQSTGVGMMGAMLRDVTPKEGQLEAAASDLQFRQYSYWRQALETTPFELPKYTQKDVADLISYVFRPENITLGVGGKVQPGEATRRWNDVVSRWPSSRLPQLYVAKPEEQPVPKVTARMSVIDFQGSAFTATDAAMTTRLLALTALGTGKAASLWRVARDIQGLSYRQEAVLSPTQEGFVPRLLIASQVEEPDKKAETLKESLLADIKNWTDEDRQRAIGMASSFLVRGGDMSPLYLLPDRPISRDLSDQVFVQAYWQMKTGTRWNPHNLVGRLGFVELDDLKQAATELVTSSRIKIHSIR